MCQGSKIIIEYNTDHVYYVLLELKRGRNSLCLHFSVDNLSAGAYLLPQWQPVSTHHLCAPLSQKTPGKGHSWEVGMWDSYDMTK